MCVFFAPPLKYTKGTRRILRAPGSLVLLYVFLLLARLVCAWAGGTGRKRMERKGAGKGREGRERKGEGREGKGRQGKGREGKGREGKAVY